MKEKRKQFVRTLVENYDKEYTKKIMIKIERYITKYSREPDYSKLTRVVSRNNDIN